MAKTTKSPLKESTKELGRIIFFAAISAVVTAVINYIAPLEDKYTWITALTVILRLADKYLHTASPEGVAGGISTGKLENPVISLRCPSRPSLNTNC